MPTEVLRFDDLRPYLLLRNGNFLYRLPRRDGWCVLKVYHGSRGRLSTLAKSFENVCFAGQTSYLPGARRSTERQCMELWSRHGFRVFEVLDDVEVSAPGCPPQGYTVMEYVSRPKLNQYLADASLPPEERVDTFRRFLAEWGRRHEIALREREPRLVHENGDGKHVMVMEDGGFLWFDFEMVYRSRRRVREHLAHEIVQYLWNILKTTTPRLRERLLDETVAHYPRPDLLDAAYVHFFRHPNPLHRLGRALDRNFGSRARKAHTKYHVARSLRERLEGA